MTARQGEGVDIRAVHHGELVIELVAMTVPGHPLADLLDISLQFLVGITGVLLENFLAVTLAEVQLLTLTHHHEIAAPGGGVDRTTAQLAEHQQPQRPITQAHGSTSSIASWVTDNIQRACPGFTPACRERSITQPRTSTRRPARACSRWRSKPASACGGTRRTNESPSSRQTPPRSPSTRSTRPRSEERRVGKEGRSRW